MLWPMQEFNILYSKYLQVLKKLRDKNDTYTISKPGGNSFSFSHVNISTAYWNMIEKML